MQKILAEISSFLDKENKLIQLPRKRKKLLASLIYLANNFETNRAYTEKEVNELIKENISFSDFATTRRALCDMNFLVRDDEGMSYRLNEKSLDLESFEEYISGKHNS